MTRRILRGSPSGSISTAATTGMPGFDAAVLAGEANLLGVRLLALQAELGPGRKDQLRLLAGLRLRLLAAPARLASARVQPCGAAFGAALGAAGCARVRAAGLGHGVRSRSATASIAVAAATANAHAAGRAGANTIR